MMAKEYVRAPVNAAVPNRTGSQVLTEPSGGTISHQHGVGLDHKNYLQAEKGTVGIDTLKSVFDHLDPEQRMNPGKLVP